MAGTRKLTVEVLGDARSAQRAFKVLGDETEGLGRQFVDFGKKTAMVFGAAAAGVGILAKGALDAAYEAQKVGKQTEAIIKSTGQAAGLTASQVGDLAEKLSYKTGVDDEAIQSSMNMLLTFKQVRNEVGAGNDIFNQASVAMLDLANVFGSSDAAAMQLGKALADPVKGITALRRAGVNFTEAQKAQIEALVESGDVLGAQKIILAEIESQVGGTAEATATSADRMRVAFGNLQEKVGMALIPVFERIAKFLVERVVPAIENLVDRYGPAIRDFFETAAARARDLASAIGERLSPIVERIGSWMRDNTDVVKVFFGVLAGAVTIAAVAGLAASLAALFNPIGLIIGAVAAAAAGIYYAYTRFETFREVVDAVGRFLQDKAWPAIQTVFDAIGDAVTVLADGFRTRWDDIRGVVRNAIDAVSAIITTFIDAVQLFWSTFGDTITAVATRVWGGIKSTIENTLEVIQGVIDLFLGIFSGNWKRAFDGLKSIVSGAVDGVLDTLGTFVGSIIDVFKELPGDLLEIGKDMVRGLWDGIFSLKDWVIDKVKGFGGAILDGIKGVFGISSPSKVMAQYGYYIVQGLADGVSKNGGMAVSAMSTVAKDMVTEINRISDVGRAGFGVFGSRTGVERAQNRLTDTQDKLVGLQQEQADLPGKIAAAEANLASLRQQLAAGTLEDSTAIISAERELEQLRQRELPLARELRDTKLDLLDAQDGLVSAQMSQNKAIDDFVAKGPDALQTFIDYATQAGLAADQIDRIVAGIKEVTTPRQTALTDAAAGVVAEQAALATDIAAATGLTGIVQDASAIRGAYGTGKKKKKNKIPALAAGGLVTMPTLALVGEAGPEAVVPLDRAGGLGNTYQIVVNAGLGTDGASIGAEIVEYIKRYERSNGTNWRAA